MKRFSRQYNYLMLAIIAIVLTMATSVYAIGLGTITDYLKVLPGKIGWEAAAYILTAILAISGIAMKAKWLSALLLVIQTTLACVATLFETIASVFGWAGSALQDGKLSSDEIKQAPEMIYQAKESIKQTWNTVRAAWGSLVDA